uniref:Uncharacterized protein n=1 Tax=Kwoniella pini CBS 10737 TaxID=1296096 RepID=A0A1B9HUH5_9TREE|nr:uncharacterized protein I206_07313 [Kwoniella pini CBS 10737]OCF46926.1 hypothetical protein I206_07313 [Kwoniella pini CBS 10737]
MSTSSKGRQSLPPMSNHAFTTPIRPNTSNNSGGGNYSGGNMILSSTRIKQQPQSIGITTSRSMGNLRGSSEGASSINTPVNGASKPKKKNKKGMKGWAWVVEDENGNIIDAPEGTKEEQPIQSAQFGRLDSIEVDEKTRNVKDNIIPSSTSSIHRLINHDNHNDLMNNSVARQFDGDHVNNGNQIDGDIYASSSLPSRGE